MSSKEDLLLAELAIEKYAEAKNLDVKTVKEKWLPILQASKEKDPFTKSLTEACAVLGQIKEVSKGLDPETREMLGKLSTVAVTRALNKEEESSDDEDKSLIRTIKHIKILDKAFQDQDQVTEEIAARVSEEVAAPLASAIDKLNATLEKVNESARTAPPETVVNNPELATLSKTVDAINTKLESLAQEVKAGAPAADVEDDVEKMVERIDAATERSKNFLAKQGFKVSPGESPTTLDEAKKIVVSSGYELRDQRVTREDAENQAKEAVEAERKKHETDLELKLEEKKIEAAKEVVKAAVDEVMKPFTYFIEKWLNTSVPGEASVPVPPGSPPAQAASTPASPESPSTEAVGKVNKPRASFKQ
jgi:F0F1-type ATP synthase membrane subunit b/b'